MSQISSRPRVQSVTGTAASLAAAGGVVLAAAFAKGLFHVIRSGIRDAQEKATAVTVANNAVIQSTRETMENIRERERLHAKRLRASGASPIESARSAIMLAVSESNGVVNDAQQVGRLLHSVASGASLETIQTARAELLESLKTNHARVLAKAIGLACERACVKTGFEKVQTTVGGNLVRIIANDPADVTLVSEIRIDSAGDISLATEVVGVTDGSCQIILDVFDRKLEEEGVRSGLPSRRSTGGVCELAAAREFLQKGVARFSIPAAPGSVRGTSNQGPKRKTHPTKTRMKGD